MAKAETNHYKGECVPWVHVKGGSPTGAASRGQRSTCVGICKAARVPVAAE